MLYAPGYADELYGGSGTSTETTTTTQTTAPYGGSDDECVNDDSTTDSSGAIGRMHGVDADGASKQEECPPGQTSEPAATACESCGPGSFAATPGAARCELAQAGFYVPGDDSRAAVGSLATEAARTAAVPCPKGRYSPGPGAKECLECAAGTYAESEQSERCTPRRATAPRVLEED